MAKKKSKRRDEIDFQNRSETRNLGVTAAHLATYIDRGEIKHHSFIGRPHVSRHLCQMAILLEGAVIEGWIEVALSVWGVPISRRMTTVHGGKRKKSNQELATEIFKLAKKSHLKHLKLNSKQKSQFISAINDAFDDVKTCIHLRNCIAHGENGIVLTQGQRKRTHKRLTEMMKGMSSENLQELLQGTRRFTDSIEMLISDRYQTMRLDIRKRILSDVSGVLILP